MSSSYPGNMPDFALSPEAYPQSDREANQKNPADMQTGVFANDAAFQFHIFRTQQRKYRMQVALLLLVVLCLGSLGALSLAPTLFPNAVQLIMPTKPSLASASTAGTMNNELQKSGCTALPTDIKYAPTSGKKKGDSVLPSAWFQAGRSKQDLLFAKACAAAFVNAYQTFSANDPRTFETCAFMLTDGGKQRFYGSAPSVQPDEHMQPMWRANMQQQEVQQTAQASEPRFVAAQYKTRLLVWMVISYQRSISIAGGQPAVETIQMTVLLIAVPVHGKETGWQVSQWRNGNIVFPLSVLL